MNIENAQVIKADLSKEFYTGEGCFIVELSNSPSDPELSIARARVEPGVTTRWHRLKRQVERYVILSGEGRMELANGRIQTVGVGDVVLIPPMCRQRICNTGAGDLIFYAICSPRFVFEDYEDVDDSPLV